MKQFLWFCINNKDVNGHLKKKKCEKTRKKEKPGEKRGRKKEKNWPSLLFFSLLFSAILFCSLFFHTCKSRARSGLSATSFVTVFIVFGTIEQNILITKPSPTNRTQRRVDGSSDFTRCLLKQIRKERTIATKKGEEKKEIASISLCSFSLFLSLFFSFLCFVFHFLFFLSLSLSLPYSFPSSSSLIEICSDVHPLEGFVNLTVNLTDSDPPSFHLNGTFESGGMVKSVTSSDSSLEKKS